MRKTYFHRGDAENTEKRGGECVSERGSKDFSHSHATPLTRFLKNYAPLWSVFSFSRSLVLSLSRDYPTPNNFPINPHPLIPAKTIRIADDTIAPNNIGHRVR